jgi:hypothetical protein
MKYYLNTPEYFKPLQLRVFCTCHEIFQVIDVFELSTKQPFTDLIPLQFGWWDRVKQWGDPNVPSNTVIWGYETFGVGEWL